MKLTQSGTNFQCLISDCIEHKVLSSRFLKFVIHARKHPFCSRNSREKISFTLARFRTRLCPWWDSLTIRLAIASLTISSFHWLIQLLPVLKLLPVSKINQSSICLSICSRTKCTLYMSLLRDPRTILIFIGPGAVWTDRLWCSDPCPYSFLVPVFSSSLFHERP